MVCPKCGTPNQDGNTFCMSCGNPLPQQAPVQQFPQAPAPQFQQPAAPQFQQAPQPQFRQPQFQQAPQPQYQPPYGQPAFRKPLIDRSVPLKQRLNIIGIIGAVILLCCIFMPLFTETFDMARYRSGSSITVENVCISQSLIDSGSLSNLTSNTSTYSGLWPETSERLFADSGKYIAMWILDLVTALAAVAVSVLGIDIGVIASGACAFIVSLLTLIFSAVDIGKYYDVFRKYFENNSYWYKSYEDLMKQYNHFEMSMGIAPILMVAVSIVIIGAGVYSIIRKKKNAPRPAMMYAQPGMMR